MPSCVFPVGGEHERGKCTQRGTGASGEAELRVLQRAGDEHERAGHSRRGKHCRRGRRERGDAYILSYIYTAESAVGGHSTSEASTSASGPV
jgi:hypothetical protein